MVLAVAIVGDSEGGEEMAGRGDCVFHAHAVALERRARAARIDGHAVAGARPLA